MQWATSWKLLRSILAVVPAKEKQKTELTTDVPIKARLLFEDVPEESIRSLLLASYLYGGGRR